LDKRLVTSAVHGGDAAKQVIAEYPDGLVDTAGRSAGSARPTVWPIYSNSGWLLK
jgi:hypothetical protein